MEQTLKQRIVPEVDERQLSRESSEVGTHVREAINDLNPLEGKNTIFDFEAMLGHAEEMQEQTEEMFEGTFAPSGEFAAEVAFGDSPAPAPEGGGAAGGAGEAVAGEAAGQAFEGLADKLGDVGGGGTTAAAAAGGGKVSSKLGSIGTKLGGLSGILTGGAAVVGLGMLSLGILSGIMGGVKKFADSSPLLGSMFEQLGLIKDLALMPIGNILGNLMLPIIADLLRVFAEFNDKSMSEGIMSGAAFLAGEILNAIFSIPGMIAIAITGAGAAIGGALGAAAAAKLGGILGGIIGSVIPVAGTTAGAAVGAVIGGTLASLVGILAAYNLDEIIAKTNSFLEAIKQGIINELEMIGMFISDVVDGIADIVTGIVAYLTPFAIRAIEWFNNVGKWLSQLPTKIKNIGGNIVEGAKEKLSDAGEFVLSKLEDAGDFVTSKLENAGDYALDKLEGASDYAQDKLESASDFVIDAGSEAKDLLVDAGTQVVGGLETAAEDFVTEVVPAAEEVASKIVNSAADFVTDITSAISEFGSEVSSAASSLASDVTSAAGDLASDVRSSATSLYNDVVNSASNLKSRVENAATSLKNDVVSSASNLASDVRNSASSLYNDVTGAASDLYSDITNAASNFVSDATNIDISQYITWPDIDLSDYISVPNVDFDMDWDGTNGFSWEADWYNVSLAEGGVVTGPTTAMIGEGNESEAVLPLSKLDSMMSTSTPSPSPDIEASASLDTDTGDNDIERKLRSEVGDKIDQLDSSLDDLIKEVKRMGADEIKIMADGKVLAETNSNNKTKYKKSREVTQ